MPGGGIEEEEFPIVAAASELHEETGLRANRIEYMLTSKSSIHNHVVFSLEADGDVVPEPEIGEYLWWDRKDDDARHKTRQANPGQTVIPGSRWGLSNGPDGVRGGLGGITRDRGEGT